MRKRIKGIEYYSAKVKEDIDLFLKKAKTYSEPINSVLNSTGVWLLSHPDINSDEVFTSIKIELSERINEQKDICYITGEKELFSFYRSGTNDLLFTWNIFTKEVVVPLYDLAILKEEENNKLNMTAQDLISEFQECRVILENKNDALLNNGLYTLYFKSLFKKKKYKNDARVLLEGIRNEILILKRKIKENQAEINKVIEDKIYTTIFLELSQIITFPYLKDFNSYKELKLN